MKTSSRLILLLCMTLVVLAGARADNPALPPAVRINEVAARIQKKYAPDHSLALFQVRFREESNTIEVESTDPEAITEFEHQLKQENIAAAVDGRPLPAKELEGKIYGVATLSVCNNRVSPANAAEMATQMLLGTPVEVLKRERGYFLVRTPDRYLAWTDDDSIKLMDAASFRQWQTAPKIVFTAEYGHAYAEPSESAPRVSDLVSGSILELVQTNGDFIKVRYPDERLAFVPVRQTMPFDQWRTQKNPNAAQIIDTAKTLLGVPYLWGGTSIKGVDCSGFTKIAFFLHGIILPRDASQQASVGEAVEITDDGQVSLEKCLTNLLPGDLLFFGRARRAEDAPRIIHTALYLGNGDFIQAAGQVRISSLRAEAPNYDAGHARTLAAARRVLGAVGTPGIARVESSVMYGSAVPNR